MTGGLGLRGGEGETKLCLSCRVAAEKAGTVTTCRMTVREQENFSRHQRQWHRGTVHLGPACELVPLYSWCWLDSLVLFYIVGSVSSNW